VLFVLNGDSPGLPELLNGFLNYLTEVEDNSPRLLRTKLFMSGCFVPEKSTKIQRINNFMIIIYFVFMTFWVLLIKIV
jgi:hypothetical protein